MLPTKFLESIGLSVPKKKETIDFQDGRHLGFRIGTIFAIFISTSHPDPFYQFSNQLALWFRKISEKKSFKMVAMRVWWPSWISDPNNLSYLRSTSHPNASFQVSSQMAFQFPPTKFGVNWSFSSGEEAKYILSRWRPSWISI